MKTIAPAQLHQFLTTHPDLALIDVRTPVEYAEVHVPRASNVPLDRLVPKELLDSGQLSKDQPVYLLCRTGGRATKAAEKFAKEGFSQAVVVEGGTLGWGHAGLPLERGTTRVISLERQVRIVAGSLVVIGIGLGYFVNPWFAGLSAFVGAGLVFAGITDFCGMGLLLAKLPWNARKPG
ncbi:MAG: rhodanese-like domain-containing protein [Terrimicrobiaceae bacterium]